MKKLQGRFESASSWLTEGEILQELSNLKARGAENIRLELEDSWGDAELRWLFDTLETDEEYKWRLKKEADEKKALEAATKKKQASILNKREKDRALYEKLKKEFES